MKYRFLIMLIGLCVSDTAGASPARTAVALPPMLHDQFLANMRDHLSAISEIQAALAEGDFGKAAEISRRRLGLGAASSAACRMSGMQTRMPGEAGASGSDNSMLSKFMPEAMHRAGFKMHSAADQFAEDAEKAAPARDYRMAMESLSRVTKQCVACHSSFKLSGR